MAQLHHPIEELTVHRTEYTELQHDDKHDEPSIEQEQEAAVHPVHVSMDDDVQITEHEIQIEQDYHEHQEHIPKHEALLAGLNIFELILFVTQFQMIIDRR